MCLKCHPSTSPEVLVTGQLPEQTLGILVTTPLAPAPQKILTKQSSLAIQTRQVSRIWNRGFKPLLLSAEHLGEPNPIGHMVLGSLQSNSPIPWAY